MRLKWRCLKQDPIGTWAKDIKDTRDVMVASAYGRDFIQDTLASADIYQAPNQKHHHGQV